jgi:hypothetical protein
MIRRTSTILSSAAASAAFVAFSSSAGFAQNAAAFDRSLDQFTCKQVMREPPAVREATVAFMHGYLLGRSNTVKFNVETLLKHTDKFIDSCLDNPTAKALEIMTKAGN